MQKLKLQLFGHLMWRTDSSEKTLMLGKIEGGRRRGQQRTRWLDGSRRLIQWTWVWVNSRSWWWTGRPSMLQSMGSHDWATELNWTDVWRTKLERLKRLSYPLSMVLHYKDRIPHTPRFLERQWQRQGKNLVLLRLFPLHFAAYLLRSGLSSLKYLIWEDNVVQLRIKYGFRFIVHVFNLLLPFTLSKYMLLQTSNSSESHPKIQL